MKALSLSLWPSFFWPPDLLIFFFISLFQRSPWLLSVQSIMFLHLSLPRAFSLLVVFVFSLVVALTWKIALESLWRMVAEVNWEGCHHRDCWSSVRRNCCMVVAEKVSEDDDGPGDDCRGSRAGTDDDGPGSRCFSRRSIILEDYDDVMFWP
jgi:hypothetical protein